MEFKTIDTPYGKVDMVKRKCSCGCGGTFSVMVGSPQETSGRLCGQLQNKRWDLQDPYGAKHKAREV